MENVEIDVFGIPEVQVELPADVQQLGAGSTKRGLAMSRAKA